MAQTTAFSDTATAAGERALLAGERALANAEENGVKRIVNGPMLKSARWAMGNIGLHPNLHRFSNAMGLFAGLTISREAMDVLAGQTVSGEAIDKKSLPFFLQPLHGIYDYNHFSDESKDRYMAVADKWLPAFGGGFGAYAGSLFFGMSQPQFDKVQNAAKDVSKLTLDQAETLIKYRQAHPWRVLSGFTSMFGSSSGLGLLPGIHNFGSTLSAAFIGHVPRDKVWAPYAPGLSEFVSGNSRSTAYGPSSELTRLQSYLLGNPSERPLETLDRAGNILVPWFGTEATPERIQNLADKALAARNKYFVQGKGIVDREAAAKELAGVLSGTGFEKSLRDIGLNPLNATVGRNGFIEAFSRAAGSNAEMNALESSYKQAYAARNKLEYVFDKAAEKVTRARFHPHDKTTLAIGTAVMAAGALGVAGLAAGSNRAKKPDASEASSDSNGEAHTANAPKKPDKLLGFLEMTADSLNSPETRGKHRAECALGMTLFGLIGMKIMEAATGRDMTGAAVPKEKIADYLQGIYKKLAYNPASDHPRDKWMFVLHLGVPTLMATSGIIAASSNFFKPRVNQAEKAEYIDQYEDKATLAEASPWTALTAISSILATPAGNPFLPIPGLNYGMSLGTRYMLSSGNKVIFPGLGEKWTGTTSRYPLGPTKLRDFMIRYAEGNPAYHAEQLEEMATGILRPLFKNVTAEQIHQLVEKVEADRHQFWQTGGVPKERIKELDALLNSHLKGAGLEETLREIDLDPAKATLGENGWAGEIAKKLGAEGKLKEIHQEFAEKYAKRQKTPLCPPSEEPPSRFTSELSPRARFNEEERPGTKVETLAFQRHHGAEHSLAG